MFLILRVVYYNVDFFRNDSMFFLPSFLASIRNWYQTARVPKLLIAVSNGKAGNYKGRSLDEDPLYTGKCLNYFTNYTSSAGYQS